MLRHSLLLAAAALATPALAQTAPPPAGADCLIRINATPTSWLITGYDPFGGSVPEATFSATFRNDGVAECRFSPSFELDQPPFGLSKGAGRPIGYALLNMSDSRDVTPRAGRSQRIPSQRDVVLGPNESRTLLYKLVADPNDVVEAGTFTQDVTLEAHDGQYRSLGGTRLVIGIDVLPSARIGLAGAYSMSNGHATVDLGELRQGPAPVPLQLRVHSTGRYQIEVSSANSSRLRLGTSEWYVPYSMSIGGSTVDLSGADILAGPDDRGYRRDALPIQFFIGEVDGKRAGTYSDVITVAVTAR